MFVKRISPPDAGDRRALSGPDYRSETRQPRAGQVTLWLSPARVGTTEGLLASGTLAVLGRSPALRTRMRTSFAAGELLSLA